MIEDRRDRIYEKVINTVAEVTGCSVTDLTGGTELIVDLNLDSLAVFEIVIDLEEAFAFRIPDEDIERIKTIDEIVDYIKRNESADSGK